MSRRRFDVQPVAYGCTAIVRLELKLKTLKPSCYCAYRQVEHSAILRFAHAVYLCVLCGYENKQRLFPYTALTDWFL